jgi:hypothetical protein
VFVASKPFEPNLIFESYAKHTRVEHFSSTSLLPKNIALKGLAQDEHSSLFAESVSDAEKSFITRTAG